MSSISTAVGSERVGRVSGYKVTKGNFSEKTKNLNQSILVLGKANSANESSMPTGVREVTSSEEVARLYGYGSMIHQSFLNLRPMSGDGVGGIPTYVLPQQSNQADVANQVEISVSGTVIQPGMHSLLINGKNSYNFQNLSFSVNISDTAAIIASKISDVVNNCLHCPYTAEATTTKVVLTCKYKGVESNENSVDFDLGDLNLGITYAKSIKTQGLGVANLVGFDEAMQIGWITSVLNPYQNLFSYLEIFNGKPYVENPTGRYNPIDFRPFMAFYGTNLSDVDDLLDFSDGSDGELTNVIIPAPNSSSTSWEISASAICVFCRVMQDTPEKDINSMYLSGIHVPENRNAGALAIYNNRDRLVKNGISTVTIQNSQYRIEDFVTTYHPQGEFPFQFSYCRNLNLDWIVKYRYEQYEELYLRDKVIIGNNQFTNSKNTIKPKQWKSNVMSLLDELAEDALITEPEFSKSKLQVEVDAVNKNRFNTFFAYKRTGVARIQSTDVAVGF